MHKKPPRCKNKISLNPCFPITNQTILSKTTADLKYKLFPYKKTATVEFPYKQRVVNHTIGCCWNECSASITVPLVHAVPLPNSCACLFEKSNTMVFMEVKVPNKKPVTPTKIINRSFTKAAGWSPFFQKVIMWISGGKMTARPELANAPISAMKSSRRGIPAASAAEKMKWNSNNYDESFLNHYLKQLQRALNFTGL